MKIYLSHSVPPHEAGILERWVQLAAQFGIELSVGPRPWDPPHQVPQAVYDAVKGADAMLVALLEGGDSLTCTNLEMGFVRNICQHVPVLVFMDENARGTGCLENPNAIRFSQARLIPAIEKARHEVKSTAQFDDQQRTAVTGFLVAAMGLLLSVRGAPVETKGAAPTVPDAKVGAT